MRPVLLGKVEIPHEQGQRVLVVVQLFAVADGEPVEPLDKLANG